MIYAAITLGGPTVFCLVAEYVLRYRDRCRAAKAYRERRAAALSAHLRKQHESAREAGLTVEEWRERELSRDAAQEADDEREVQRLRDRLIIHDLTH